MSVLNEIGERERREDSYVLKSSMCDVWSRFVAVVQSVSHTININRNETKLQITSSGITLAG